MTDQENTQQQMQSQSDHDLLLIVNTQLSSLITDVKHIRDNTVSKIELMEKTKIDEAKVLAMKVEHDKVHAKLEADTALVHADIEKRMRRNERLLYTGMGGLAVLQFIVLYFK